MKSAIHSYEQALRETERQLKQIRAAGELNLQHYAVKKMFEYPAINVGCEIGDVRGVFARISDVPRTSSPLRLVPHS